jgi:hypothetical protein
VQWNVRLEGGPADGDTAICDGPLPPKVFTTFCTGCKDWHWFSIRKPGSEVYNKSTDDPANSHAKYVYSELGVPGEGIDTRTREPVLA